MIKIDDLNLARIKEIISSLEKDTNALTLDEVTELRIIIETLERTQDTTSKETTNSSNLDWNSTLFDDLRISGLGYSSAANVNRVKKTYANAVSPTKSVTTNPANSKTATTSNLLSDPYSSVSVVAGPDTFDYGGDIKCDGGVTC